MSRKAIGALRRSMTDCRGANPVAVSMGGSPWSSDGKRDFVTRRSASSHRRHRVQELRVAARLLELLDQELHRLHRRQRREHLAQNPDAVELRLLQKQLFLARARLVDVDGREDALVGELAVEV